MPAITVKVLFFAMAREVKKARAGKCVHPPSD